MVDVLLLETAKRETKIAIISACRQDIHNIKSETIGVVGCRAGSGRPVVTFIA